MTNKRSGGGPDTGDAGSWANESIPLSVRKELLERELNKLGFRKAGAHGGNTTNEASSSQQGDSGSSHPQADTQDRSEHAE
jgi:hypothetical protein